MDDVNQKKKMILLGIGLVGILAVIILVVLLVLSAAEAKKTKVVLGNVTYKTKVTQLQEENGGQVFLKTSIVDPKTKKEKPFMITTANDGDYFNIKTIAEDFCGYVYNKGLYGGIPDESSDKCHVVSSGETVSFSSTSNEITKYLKQTDKYEGELSYKSNNKNKNKNDEIEIFSLEGTPVIRFADGQLYASLETIQKGLNLTINKNGVIYTIYPLETLISSYRNVLNSNGYSLTSNFRNQRALYERLAVCEQNGAYCVVEFLPDNSINKVISSQYESIEYVQSIGNFIVSVKNRQTGELKFGMNSPEDGKAIIPAEYDSLQLLDAKNNLYLTQSNERYGVVRSEGNDSVEIIKPEYESIGLDSVIEYANQDITNPYLVDDYTIITKKNNKYGLTTIEGEEILRPKVQTIGCSNPSDIIKKANGVDITAYPTMIVPIADDIKLIVISMNNKYGLMDPQTGGFVVNTYFTAIYYTQENGRKTYYFHKIKSDGDDEKLTLQELIQERKLDSYIENKRKSRNTQTSVKPTTSSKEDEEEEEEEEEQEEQEEEQQPDEQEESQEGDSYDTGYDPEQEEEQGNNDVPDDWE